MTIPLSALLLSGLLLADLPAPLASKPFAIRIVDEATGRGVPLVELKTVHQNRYLTDSDGYAVVRDPELMGQKVFFYVKSHGYEFPKDGFGFRGKNVDVVAGGLAEWKIQRKNIAERLYRLTGAGIYADTVELGKPAPIAKPLLNGQVFGSDSVVTSLYRGKLHWFWGDTNRPSYPLGNFNVPGATSLLPAQGGLDPERGVDLTYFVDKTGFAKQMAPVPGKGPTWIFGLVTLKDKSGNERLFASYMKVEGQFHIYERGLVEFNDALQQFERVLAFPLDSPYHSGGHTLLRTDNGVEYVYFSSPFPSLRVPADPESLKDLKRYQGFTPLKEGTSVKDEQPERGPDGRVRYAWKTATPPLSVKEEREWIRKGLLKADETRWQLQDRDGGKGVLAHGGSVHWNDYRKKWISLAVEGGGTSMLGEMWYAEADAPEGPWKRAVKVATHERYSFYNPKHHSYFDKEGGKVIFFEGTYTHSFSGNVDQTPRYDYNQVMYKLDLSDPRLKMD